MCLLVDSLWEIGQQNRWFSSQFGPFALPSELFSCSHADLFFLSHATACLTWDVFFSKPSGSIASRQETPETTVKRINYKNRKVITYSEWLFNRNSEQLIFSGWFYLLPGQDSCFDCVYKAPTAGHGYWSWSLTTGPYTAESRFWLSKIRRLSP